MRKILGFILVSVSAWNANADVSCSSAGQEIKYTYDHVETGIRPMPGDLISSETIVLSGRSYGPNERFERIEYRPKFAVNFDHSTKNILAEKRSRSGSETTYSIRLDSVTVGLPGLGHILTIDKFVVCTDIELYVP